MSTCLGYEVLWYLSRQSGVSCLSMRLAFELVCSTRLFSLMSHALSNQEIHIDENWWGRGNTWPSWVATWTLYHLELTWVFYPWAGTYTFSFLVLWLTNFRSCEPCSSWQRDRKGVWCFLLMVNLTASRITWRWSPGMPLRECPD